MKKVLFLTLCIVAVFSIATVCFAAGVEMLSSADLEKLLGESELRPLSTLSGETVVISRAPSTESNTSDSNTVNVRPSTTTTTPTRPSTATTTPTRPSRGTASGESYGVATRPSTSTSTSSSEEGDNRFVLPADFVATIMSGDTLPSLRPGLSPEIIEAIEAINSGDRVSAADLLEALDRPIARRSGDVFVLVSGDSKKEEDKKEEEKAEPVEKVIWAEASTWAIDELNTANDKGLIPPIFGKENLKSNITRKEFAHVAVKLYERLAGKKAEKASKNPFTDTKDEEVLKAYNVGVTQGTSETTFAPDTEITREQMATMITRALEKAGVDVSVDLTKVKEFTDDSEMHNWSRGAIYFMAEKGIINGVDTKAYRYGVKNNASREQALAISNRSSDKFAK